MECGDEKRKLRNEKKRLAYRSMGEGEKAQLLERRRQQYKRRVVGRQNAVILTNRASDESSSQPVNCTVVDYPMEDFASASATSSNFSTHDDQDDFARNAHFNQFEVEKKTLQAIDEFLMCMGKSIHDYSLVPHFQRLTEEEKFTRELAYEKSIPIAMNDLCAISMLNEKQRIVFNDVIRKIDFNESGAFFVDGPGGTGKTFLYRALLAYVRSKGHIALAVATSGVAAALLPGGRTAHSRFKLPIDPEERFDAKISKQSSLAKMILIAKLIIWDEASMANRKIIEAFDDLLRDITDECSILFGDYNLDAVEIVAH